FNVFDTIDISFKIGGWGHGPLNGKDDILGRKWGAVMKTDPITQLEYPFGGLGLLPGNRQSGHQVKVLIVFHQGLVNIAAGSNGRTPFWAWGVKGEIIARAGPGRLSSRLVNGKKKAAASAPARMC